MTKQSNVASARLLAGKAFTFLVALVAACGLVLGFCQPKAAKADTPAYKLTDTLEAGQQYLIVNANTAGDAYALKNNAGTAEALAVTINEPNNEALRSSTHDNYFIENSDGGAVWNAVSEDGYLKLKNGDYYLQVYGSSYTLTIASPEYTKDGSYTQLNWAYNSSKQLVYTYMSGTSSRTMYLAYSSNKWAGAQNGSAVYIYALDSDPVAVEGVTLDATASVAAGSTTTLTATVLPEDATNKNVNWSSSDTSVATVSGGAVTGVAEGTATITATTVDGEFTASCVVTVTAAPKYYLVSTPTVGKQYVIVNTDSAGSAYALGSNGTAVASDSVEVKSDIVEVIKSDADGVYVQGDIDATSVWTVGEGITLQSSNGYLRSSSSSSMNLLSVNATQSSNWTYNSSNQLKTTSRYLMYTSGNWTTTTRSSSATKVYFYELEEAAPEPTMYTVTFLDEDGEQLSSAQYEEGTAGSEIDAPADQTKEATAEYTYVFAGWNDGENTYASAELPAVNADVTYTATFTSTKNQYTVTFLAEDGVTVLQEEASYDYGTTVDGITVPAEPTKEATAQYTYAFAGWSDGTNTYASADLPAVTADVTYTATFSETVNQYTVTFVDWDESVISSATYDYGTLAARITPADPTRDPDDQYTYEFAGWDATVVDVVGEVTYRATYTATEIVRNQIVTHPADTAAAAGQALTLSVVATGDVASYRWEHSYDDGASWRVVKWAGRDTDTISHAMVEALDGRMFRCVVTFEDGSYETSEAATVTLAAEPV